MPIPVITSDEAAAMLAEFEERGPGRVGVGEASDLKDAAVKFAATLAKLYGLTRDETLWDRIAGALATACDRVRDGDLERFATLCLDHVKAPDGEASRSEPLARALETFAARPEPWRLRFVIYCREHRIPLVVAARARWLAHRDEGADL